jgi:hypothetical protein
MAAEFEGVPANQRLAGLVVARVGSSARQHRM